jgi:hypothetical protein
VRLSAEAGEVDNLKLAEVSRRKKVDRARRKLERIRNENLAKEKMIEK